MVNPNIWGKHGWKFLHFIAQGFPNNPTQKDIDNFKTFFYLIQFVLPCDKCRLHYSQHLNNFPLDNHIFKNSDTLQEWIINIHNQVNISNNKPMIDNYQAKKIIQNNIDTCINNSSNPPITEHMNNLHKNNIINIVQENLSNQSNTKTTSKQYTNNNNLTTIIILLIIAFFLYLFFK